MVLTQTRQDEKHWVERRQSFIITRPKTLSLKLRLHATQTKNEFKHIVKDQELLDELVLLV